MWGRRKWQVRVKKRTYGNKNSIKIDRVKAGQYYTDLHHLRNNNRNNSNNRHVVMTQTKLTHSSLMKMRWKRYRSDGTRTPPHMWYPNEWVRCRKADNSSAYCFQLARIKFSQLLFVCLFVAVTSSVLLNIWLWWWITQAYTVQYVQYCSRYTYRWLTRIWRNRNLQFFRCEAGTWVAYQWQLMKTACFLMSVNMYIYVVQYLCIIRLTMMKL